MDRSKNNSLEFGKNSTASAAAAAVMSAPWANNKESPTLPNEDDSPEDDADNATPAKVTDPLAPRLANNEVIKKYQYEFDQFFFFFVRSG